MKMTQQNTLMDLLENGYEIHYAPVSGGIILMKNGKRQDSIYSVSISEFLELRSSGVIDFYHEWKQSHSILHGMVMAYKLK